MTNRILHLGASWGGGGGGGGLAITGTPVRAIQSGGGVLTLNVPGISVNLNDIIVVLSTGKIVSGITGSKGTYALLGNVTQTSAGDSANIWWALATSAGTESLTITQASGSFCEAIAFGVSGANTSSPWDALSGSGFETNPTFHSTGPTVTTAAGPRAIIGVGCEGSGSGPYAADTGWTQLNAVATNGLYEYRIEASAGSFVFNASDYFLNCGIAAALK